MPHINDLMESKYIKKADLGERGLLLTFSHLSKENVAPQGQPQEMKNIAYFNEHAKGLVLNKTNLGLMAAATGADNTDNWPGKQVVLYWDPSVMYKGELKGGVRIRQPLPGAAAQPPTQAYVAPPAAARNSDIPF